MPRLLPILGLPLVADGVLTLAVKLKSRSAEREAADGVSIADPER